MTINPAPTFTKYDLFVNHSRIVAGFDGFFGDFKRFVKVRSCVDTAT